MSYASGLRRFVPAVLLLVAGGAQGAEPADPKADPRACVVSGDVRFTVLTPSLIRMEYEPGAKFEDRATYAFINRKLPVPKYSILHNGGWLDIRTSEIQLRYKEGSGKFTSETLAVTVLHVGAQNNPVTWHPGTADTGNLMGTVRTLDQADGAIPLEPGIVSREGWAIVDDTTRTLLTTDGHKPGDPLADWPWAAERPQDPERQDLYFFGYGHDYQRALLDFTNVAGKVPMPPRWAFGAWWSRYWAYTDQGLKDLVDEFREHGVPLDVLVVDMDWHLDGWTGYTWNKEYFPDPEGFLKWAHDEGLQVTLNLHPADGVRPHEAAYPEFAKLMGVDPGTSAPIPFDITNAKFVDGYFRLLHHPLEKQGVDFWWIDWQQGTQTKLTNIDPLHWLNYLHWTDMERNPARAGLRPLLFSRWGGLGNHRYQTGFSGDTYNDWASLGFQPYFTATAGNVGYSYWSHDIGGHMPGPVAPDLYDRWLQWAAFNPILRTHGGKNPATERRIWAFPEDAYQIAKQAWYLRYSLIPYIYSAARQCYDSALPLCRPLYYQWPEIEEAYSNGGEYLYGSDLLVHPVVEPADPLSSCTLQKTWLPPGTWIDWYTDEITTGPAEIETLVSMDRVPVWARAGAIIPTASVRRGDTSHWAMQDDTQGYRTINVKPKDAIHSTAEQDDSRVALDIFPGEQGSCVLYQDDRRTTGYQLSAAAVTSITKESSSNGSVTTVTISPAEGTYPGMPEQRSFELRLRSVGHVAGVRLLVNGKEAQTSIPAGSILQVLNPTCFGDYILERTPRFSVRDTVQFVFSRDVSCDAPALASAGVRQLLHVANAATTGIAAPGSSTLSPTSLLEELCRRGGGPERLRNSIMNKLFAELSQTGAGDRMLKYILELLGISARLELKPSGNDMQVTLVIRRVAERSLDLPFEAEMTVDGGGLGLATMPKAGNVLSRGQTERRVTWKVHLPANPQPIQVHVRLGFNWQGANFYLPLDASVWPSIPEWYVLGPFDNPGGVTLDKVFPPEESPFNAQARFMGKSGPVGWKKVARKRDESDDLTGEFVVDLHKAFGSRVRKAAAYAYTNIRSERDTKATLYIGSDDGVAAWLNGNEIWRNPSGRPYHSRSDKVEVELKKGDNPLMLKISQGTNDWKFCVHVEIPPAENGSGWVEQQMKERQMHTPGPPPKPVAPGVPIGPGMYPG
jgi:alpha-glucosidase